MTGEITRRRVSTPVSRPSPYHSECYFNLWPQVKSRTGACRYSHSPSDARSYSAYPPPATTSVSLPVVSADLPPQRPTVLRIPRNGTNTGSTLVHAKEQPPRDNNTQLPTEGQPKTSRQGEERFTSEVTAEGGPTTTTTQTNGEARPVRSSVRSQLGHQRWWDILRVTIHAQTCTQPKTIQDLSFQWRQSLQHDWDVHNSVGSLSRMDCGNLPAPQDWNTNCRTLTENMRPQETLLTARTAKGSRRPSKTTLATRRVQQSGSAENKLVDHRVRQRPQFNSTLNRGYNLRPCLHKGFARIALAPTSERSTQTERQLICVTRAPPKMQLEDWCDQTTSIT